MRLYGVEAAKEATENPITSPVKVSVSTDETQVQALSLSGAAQRRSHATFGGRLQRYRGHNTGRMSTEDFSRFDYLPVHTTAPHSNIRIRFLHSSTMMTVYWNPKSSGTFT